MQHREAQAPATAPQRQLWRESWVATAYAIAFASRSWRTRWPRSKPRWATQTHGKAAKIHGRHTSIARACLEAQAAEEAPPQEEVGLAEGQMVAVATERAQEHILEGHRG